MRFSWTDTHGIGQCLQCGVPYRLYHYDGNNKSINKPPACLVKEAWIPICQRFWNESQSCMPSGKSFPGGQELATAEDIQRWKDWLEKNKEIIPVEQTG
jgi:hypothetical protein